MMLFKKILVCLILFVLLSVPLLAAAQIGEYIKKLYETAIGVGGIAAVAVIVFGAIYITLSGSSPQRRQEGRSYIIAAIWGIVLLLGAYIILNTINPQLVTLSPPGGETLTSSKKEIPGCPLSAWESCDPYLLTKRGMQLTKLLDCDRGCEQAIQYRDVTPIEVEQIHRFPLYPSKAGPQYGECVIYAYTDMEGNRTALNRRGLNTCPPPKK